MTGPQICGCGRFAGYPHAADCPWPDYRLGVDARMLLWKAARAILRGYRYPLRAGPGPVPVLHLVGAFPGPLPAGLTTDEASQELGGFWVEQWSDGRWYTLGGNQEVVGTLRDVAAFMLEWMGDEIPTAGGWFAEPAEACETCRGKSHPHGGPECPECGRL